jgi:hypothetical protein
MWNEIEEFNKKKAAEYNKKSKVKKNAPRDSDVY